MKKWGNGWKRNRKEDNERNLEEEAKEKRKKLTIKMEFGQRSDRARNDCRKRPEMMTKKGEK